jgi:hypothetical protein
MLVSANKFFGVTYANKRSQINVITQEEVQRKYSNTQNTRLRTNTHTHIYPYAHTLVHKARELLILAEKEEAAK